MSRVTAKKVSVFLNAIREHPSAPTSVTALTTLQSWAYRLESEVDDSLRYQLLRAIDEGREALGDVVPLPMKLPLACPSCGAEVSRVRVLEGPTGALRDWRCSGQDHHDFRSWDKPGKPGHCVVFRRTGRGGARSRDPGRW
jgi:hypothetical protein